MVRGGLRQASPRSGVDVVSYRDRVANQVLYRPACSTLVNMDEIPFVVDACKRDLDIENYYVGHLKHIYVSLSTGVAANRTGMMRNLDGCARRLREGWEFFRFFVTNGKAVG